MSRTVKGILIAMAAVVAIAIVIGRSQPDGAPTIDTSSLPDGPATGAGSVLPIEESSSAAREAAKAGQQQIPIEALEPHSIVVEQEQLEIKIPIEPVPDHNAARRDGQGAVTSDQGGPSGSGAPGGPAGMSVPAANMGQGPVALGDAGAPPEAGAPPVIGPGPGGEESGIAGIPPVELGPENDPGGPDVENVDLGPPPEATDPGIMGPAPEDSGG